MYLTNEQIAHIKFILHKVLRHTEEVTGEPALAGGCLLDLAYGHQPKDFDAVIPLGPDQEDADVFSDMVEISEVLASNGYKCSLYLSYGKINGIPEKDFDSRLYSAMHVERGDLHVDLLFSRYIDVPEAVQHFDCTFNMAYQYLRDIDYPERMTNMEVIKKTKYHFIRHDVTDMRYGRMQHKAGLYGFNLCKSTQLGD